MQRNKRYPLHLNQVAQICADTVAAFKEFYAAVLGKKRTDSLVNEIALMTGEACTNAIRHTAGIQRGSLVVQISCERTVFEITVIDRNPAFDFYNCPEPDFEAVPESGYGFHIIKTIADRVVYTRQDSCNRLQMIKKIHDL